MPLYSVIRPCFNMRKLGTGEKRFSCNEILTTIREKFVEKNYSSRKFSAPSRNYITFPRRIFPGRKIFENRNLYLYFLRFVRKIIRQEKLFFGEIYSSWKIILRENYSSGKLFVGENFSSGKFSSPRQYFFTFLRRLSPIRYMH